MMQTEIKYSVVTRDDFPSIIDLQRTNLFKNLTPEQRRTGFLTVEFDEDSLEDVINDIGIVKAFTETDLVGYLMAQTLEFNARFPLLAKIISRFPSIEFQSRVLSEANTFIAGPMCVAKEWRGRDIPQGLFNRLLSMTRERFDIGVTFIDETNYRSLGVSEKKLGMTIVDRIDFDGKNFSILAFNAAET